MPDFQHQINQRIESFVAEITELARQHAINTLSQALEHPGWRSPSSAAALSGAGKRPPAAVKREAERLFAYIQANPGQRAEEIAVSLGATTKQLSLPMKKLLSAERVRSEGQKRATRYFPARAGQRGRPSNARRKKRGKK